MKDTRYSHKDYNIKTEQVNNTYKVSFSKYVYGFFHADIIGELNYVYEYQDNIQGLAHYKEFLPYEHYEIVDA